MPKKKYVRPRKLLLEDIKFANEYVEAMECETNLLNEELKDTKVLLKFAMDFIMKYTHECPKPQWHSEDCPDAGNPVVPGTDHDNLEQRKESNEQS